MSKPRGGPSLPDSSVAARHHLSLLRPVDGFAWGCICSDHRRIEATMRLLMLSTNGEPCGIADYNSALGAAFVGLGHFIDIVRIPRFDPAGLATACEIFRRRLREFDLGLVQHEWGFFGSDFRQSAQCLTELLKS